MTFGGFVRSLTAVRVQGVDMCCMAVHFKGISVCVCGLYIHWRVLLVRVVFPQAKGGQSVRELR